MHIVHEYGEAPPPQRHLEHLPASLHWQNVPGASPPRRTPPSQMKGVSQRSFAGAVYLVWLVGHADLSMQPPLNHIFGGGHDPVTPTIGACTGEIVVQDPHRPGQNSRIMSRAIGWMQSSGWRHAEGSRTPLHTPAPLRLVADAVVAGGPPEVALGVATAVVGVALVVATVAGQSPRRCSISDWDVVRPVAHLLNGRLQPHSSSQ